ncbi:MAG: metal ABC transporter permease [bacterium]
MVELIVTTALAGVGVALIAGPLGTFVVWRRMAYFGDTLAHASLLGIALSLGLTVAPGIAVVAVCLLLALILVALEHQTQLALDTLLGILSHSALALGVVILSLMPDYNVNFEGLLFGDLLAISPSDVVIIWCVAAGLLGLLIAFWQPLLAVTVHEQLAVVEGVNGRAVKTLLMLMLAFLIAIAIKIVGVLLITALLVIPAAASRRFSNTPEQMGILASAIGISAVLSGLTLAWFLDTPAGPSIVVMLGVIFGVSRLLRRPEKGD